LGGDEAMSSMVRLVSKIPGTPIVLGLLRTLGKFLFMKRFTLQYPEQRLPQKKGYRGEHRLKRDELGRPKCVACLMCQSACPAQCISITATESPWPDREKVPLKFEINMLECIYCGMCEEACPCDAIELTPRYNVVSTTREEKIYDLTKLLYNDYVPADAETVPPPWLGPKP
jgi:NADH-quinone oxidoreductase subunit I